MAKTETDSRILLLLGIIAVLMVPLTESEECYPCEDRQKLGQTGNCSNTEEDCEGCLEGLHEYSWTPYSFCGPTGVTIVKKDTNVTLPYGSTAVLRCEFEEPVDCIWQRNAFQVDILQFVSGSNGTNTTDCSIRIVANRTTVGNWDCRSLADDYRNAIEGSRATISLVATITEAPLNATIHTGDNSTLTCTLDMPVTCYWMHNGTSVPIEDRYKFTGSSGNGQETTDCSIRIADFRYEDSGEWRCGCEGKADLVQTLSAACWLTVFTKDTPVNHEPEWALVLAVVGSVVAIIVVVSIVLACVYGCGVKYKAVSQKDYELGETTNGRPPVLLSD